MMVESYAKKLCQAASENENIAVIDCDLSKSFRSKEFSRLYPERYFNVGIAEQNAFSIAAGLASLDYGYIPFVHTFAMFASMRACDQISNSICYTNMNVKIISQKIGFGDSEGGATHQSIEDIGIMSAIPNLSILSPCDDYEAEEAVEIALNIKGPCYIRLSNKSSELGIHKMEYGKGRILIEGEDLFIFASSDILNECMLACKILNSMGYKVGLAAFSTLKPLDTELIQSCAKKAKLIMTVEVQNVLTGLGSQVCRILSGQYPVPVKTIGIENQFTESGTFNGLLSKYGLDPDGIVNKAVLFMKSRVSEKQIKFLISTKYNLKE
jgi:transketolase